MSKSETKVIVVTLVSLAIFFTFAVLCAMSIRGEDFVCINEDLKICRDSWVG